MHGYKWPINCTRTRSQMLSTLPKLDILINNAAQTLTRPETWTVAMAKLENAAVAQLSDISRGRIALSRTGSSTTGAFPYNP